MKWTNNFSLIFHIQKEAPLRAQEIEPTSYRTLARLARDKNLWRFVTQLKTNIYLSPKFKFVIDLVNLNRSLYKVIAPRLLKDSGEWNSQIKLLSENKLIICALGNLCFLLRSDSLICSCGWSLKDFKQKTSSLKVY